MKVNWDVGVKCRVESWWQRGMSSCESQLTFFYWIAEYSKSHSILREEPFISNFLFVLNTKYQKKNLCQQKDTKEHEKKRNIKKNICDQKGFQAGKTLLALGTTERKKKLCRQSKGKAFYSETQSKKTSSSSPIHHFHPPRPLSLLVKSFSTVFFFSLL